MTGTNGAGSPPCVLSRPSAAEAALVAGVAVLGLTLRLSWVHLVPTGPFSDFASILHLAEGFARNPVAAGSPQWHTLSPGTSLFVSLGLRASSGSPADVARLMTALVTGLVPLLPVLIWRGVMPFWVRAVAGLTLAVWPGQVVFSGVLSQDNWAIAPAVALGSVAVKTIQDRTPRPLASALLLGVAFLIRQELLVALSPLALGGAGLVPAAVRRRRSLTVFVAILAAFLASATGLRYVGSGRLALTTTHAAVSTLASTVPGSSWAYNAPPYSYLETFAPGREPSQVAPSLVRQELARRPAYHVVRVTYFTLAPFLRSSRESLYWSLSPEALPEAYRARADRALNALREPLTWEMLAVVYAGFASLVLALTSRNIAVLLLASSVVLKLGVHALTVSQPRYYYPVTAMILLAVPVAAWFQAAEGRRRRLLVRAAVAALPCTIGVAALVHATEGWTQSHDTSIDYRFEIGAADGRRVRCVTRNAGIWTWYPRRDEKPISFFRPDPAPGDVAETACGLLTGHSTAPLSIQVPLLGLPDVVRLSVASGGDTLADLDLCTPLPRQQLEVPVGASRPVVIRLQRLHGDPALAVGHAVQIILRMRAGPPEVAITGTNPDTIRAGTRFNVQSGGESAIAVLGHGFSPGDQITWSGVALATTYGGPGLLTAVVPESLFATPAQVTLEVGSAEWVIRVVP